MNTFRYTGKTLVVTGASSGIGNALALGLSRAGTHLVLNARRTELLRQTADDCAAHGVRVVASPGDVSTSSTCREIMRAAAHMPHFCGIVHCAGVLRPGPLLREMDIHGFDEVFGASVRGAFLLARHGLPLMGSARDAVFVLFGSGAAEIAQPGIAAYCAAKAAEEHLARQIAAEEPGVATFVYRPGIVETSMQIQARSAEGGASEALHEVFRPWKEKGLLLTPEESALGLIRLLDAGPAEFRGKIMDVRRPPVARPDPVH